jgi:hypothetical protein
LEASGQLHASAAFPPGKEPPVPIIQKAGWPQTGLDDVQGEILFPCWDSNFNVSAAYPIANKMNIFPLYGQITECRDKWKIYLRKGWNRFALLFKPVGGVRLVWTQTNKRVEEGVTIRSRNMQFT